MINEKVKNNNVTDIIKTPKKSIIPRSEKQKSYVRALRESDIVISAGPAGTGKTFLAVAVGLTMLLEKKNRKNYSFKTSCRGRRTFRIFTW